MPERRLRRLRRRLATSVAPEIRSRFRDIAQLAGACQMPQVRNLQVRDMPQVRDIMSTERGDARGLPRQRRRTP
jgi:hypothetical protein